MIALDTSLLVYAHRAGAPEHRAAQRAIERACTEPGGCGVALATVTEFWSLVTHPALSSRPSRPAEASAFLERLVEGGELQVWSPGAGFAERLVQLAVELDVRGARVFDLQIALTALEQGARQIWTHDQGFKPVPGLRVVDPLG